MEKQNGSIQRSKDSSNNDIEVKTKALFLSAPDLKFEYYPEKQKTLPNEPIASWITLASCFLGNVILGYHVITFSVYYVEFTEAFGTTKAIAGTVGAIHGFFSAIIGLFASVVIKLFGCKACSMIGGLCTATGLFLSAFAGSIYHLHITFGIITGIGLGFVVLPNLTLIQQSFNKHRAVATSFAVCGIPLGNLVSPMATTFLIQRFGWRGALMIHSGIVLNTLVCTLLWRQPLAANVTTGETKKSLAVMLKSLFDFTIMRNPYFVLYTIANALCRFNLSVFITQSPSRAVFYGYSLQAASVMLTCLCICSLISRISISIILRFCEINPIALGTAIGFIQCSMSFLVTLSTNYVWTVFCTVIFGLAQGGVIIQCLLSLVKIAGAQTFARTRAVYNVFIAFMNITPTPVTGWIFDITQNYNFPFYAASIVGCIGSVLMLVLYFLMKSSDAREQRDTAKETAADRDKSLKPAFKITDERTRTYTF